MGIARRIVWLAVFVAALVGGWKFAGSNGSLVRVDYLFGVFGAVPLWLALVASASAGAVAAVLALSARLTRSSLAQRRYRKTVAALESEVHQLRNLPVDLDDTLETLPGAARSGDEPGDTDPIEAAR